MPAGDGGSAGAERRAFQSGWEKEQSMQEDFHYYATYCAAHLAGYSPEECLEICYSAQLVDWCSATFLSRIKGPAEAATTQLQMELMETRTDTVGLQNITRIWASFHFLPFDLYAGHDRCSKGYLNKYRLICNTNSDLLEDTVNLAKDKGLQAAGLAMHVLADTWAHRYFAGTPSMVINNTNHHFFEIIPEGDTFTERRIKFNHNPGAKDDCENGIYTNTINQYSENSIMSLGHGRAGHLPDYSFMRYRYLPAWGEYSEIIKDNPSDYYDAFCQMVYALKVLKSPGQTFEKDRYDREAVKDLKDEIKQILEKRRTDACDDWKALGEKLTGVTIDDFDMNKYNDEYTDCPEEKKNGTFLGRFILAALAQKSMVTERIYKSGNRLAGISVDYSEKGFKGIKGYRKLVEQQERGA